MKKIIGRPRWTERDRDPQVAFGESAGSVEV